MKTNKILLILLSIGCLLFSMPLEAQDTKSITISGKVLEANTKNPIPYATVALIGVDGKTSGTVTSENGSFEFTTEAGAKKIEISFVGYVKYTTERDITESVHLGEILLQEDAKVLSEVVVKASKPIVKREVDRLVIDAKSLSAISSNAIDLLKSTPGILVSDDGYVSVIGKGKIIVLFNGRESHLTDQELAAYLKGMQSHEIERIEVMTTPPSKYSAEGEAGVINIVERKKLSDYFGGSIIDQHLASKGQANDLSGSIKYQNGNLFLYANTLFGFGDLKNESFEDRTYSNTRWKQTSYITNSNKYGSGNVGFELNLPKKFNVGGNYSFTSFSPSRNVIEEVTVVDKMSTLDYTFNGYDDIYRKMIRHEGSMFLAKDWDNDKSAKFDVNYIHFDLDEDDKYQSKGNNDFGYNNKFNRSNDILVTKFDVEIPTQKVDVSFGTSYQYTLTKNNASYLDNPEIPNQYDNFRYTEQIAALYTDFKFKPFEKIISKIGLRGEATFVDGKQLSNNEKITRKLFHLFPTFFLNYTPHQNHVLSFSYASRITRPTFDILNPFKRYQNQYNIVTGAPYLSPSISHTLDLGYTFRQNLNFNISYVNKKGLVDIVPKILSDGKILHSYQNAYDLQMLLLSSNYRWVPSNWLNITIGAFGYYMKGHSDVYVKPVDNEGWSFLVYGIGTVYFNKSKTLVAEINAQYQSKEEQALRKVDPRYYLHTGMKYIALKGKLSFGLQLQNLLNSGFDATQITPEGYNVYQSNSVYRKLKIFITYNFGGNIKKNIRNDSNNDRLGEKNYLPEK